MFFVRKCNILSRNVLVMLAL